MGKSIDYKEFIKNKQRTIQVAGFKAENLNPLLFPFQKHCVEWALKKGRAALFLDSGLGKTICQLEFAQKVYERHGKPILILAPLAVSKQTIQEGIKFGYEVKYTKDGTLKDGINITNYDRVDTINADGTNCIILDESGILKAETGKTRNKIIDKFEKTQYKLCCSATPSPNDFTELGNHSEFLNIMSRLEMLSMYFKHNSASTNDWVLKGYAENDYFNWLSKWSKMAIIPSDIGYSDEGYILPKLNYIEHQIKTDKRDDGKLFNDINVSAMSFNQELRNTQKQRLELTASIVNNSVENFIVWTNLNEDSKLITKLIPDAVEVTGSESLESKEKKLLGFANNEFRVLVTKKKIAQFGLNLQNCHNQIYASLDFSFEGTYQAIRRSYRFGQKHEVNIHLITTDTMANVIKIIKKKEENFNYMRNKMNKEINTEHQEIKYVSEKTKNENWQMIHGDSIEETKNIPSNSIDYMIFSPPFLNLYVYTDLVTDIGNGKNDNEFWQHYDYLIPELKRVVKDGRNISIHCSDIPLMKGKDGVIGLKDFPGDIVKQMERHGFILHSRVIIWKDPLIEAIRTRSKGLQHRELLKDSTNARSGIADQLLTFKKAGINEVPVKHEGLNKYYGNDKDGLNILVREAKLRKEKANTGFTYKEVYSQTLFQKYASSVWMDIRQTNTLNTKEGKDGKDDKHICPLQLDTIARAIYLYSNPEETVLSPFAGIGSEGYQALLMDRKFIGIELKKSYYETAIKNLQRAEIKKTNEYNIINFN